METNIDYKEKYLKYKQKYLNFKNLQSGGATMVDDDPTPDSMTQKLKEHLPESSSYSNIILNKKTDTSSEESEWEAKLTAAIGHKHCWVKQITTDKDIKKIVIITNNDNNPDSESQVWTDMFLERDRVERKVYIESLINDHPQKWHMSGTHKVGDITHVVHAFGFIKDPD